MRAGGRHVCALLAAALLWAGPAGGATQHRPILGIAAEERLDRDAFTATGTEWMTKVSPEAGWRATNERLELESAYALDLIHHLEGGNFTLDHRGRLVVRGEATRRLTLTARASLYRVEDTATLPRFGVANLRAPALWSTAEALAAWRLSHTETLEAGYAGEVSHLYTRGLPLGIVHAGHAQLRSRLSERFEVGLRYRLQHFSADFSPFAVAHAPTLRARYQPSRHTFAEAEGGPVAFLEAERTSWMPRLRAEAGYEARGVGVGLVAGRDVVGAAGYATAVWADYAQLVLTWRAMRPLNLHVLGGAFRNGLAPGGATAATGYGISAGAELDLAPGLSAQVGYDRIGQFDLEGRGLGLARDIGTLRLVYRLP